MKKFELHIPVEEKERTIIDLLSANCSLSKNTIKLAINNGALWLERNKSTRRLRKAKKVLNVADTVHFYFNEEVLSQAPPPCQLIKDYQDYSIWFKPYGILCQGSKWSDHCTISRYVELNDSKKRPAFIVHRLDRAASGLVIIAHSKSAAKSLSRMFELRNIKKQYQIVSHGLLGRSVNNAIDGEEPIIVTTEVDDKPAKSTFSVIDKNIERQLTHFLVDIETGRKHQIRIHAASINFPVVGDRLHGKKQMDYHADLNLQLCAVKLSFVCPITNKEIIISLPEKLRPNISNVVNLLKS